MSPWLIAFALAALGIAMFLARHWTLMPGGMGP